MKSKYFFFKISALITTLMAVVFMFFDWFIIDTGFSKADSISIMTLPDFFLQVHENTGSLVDTIFDLTGSKTITSTVIIVCGVLKYASLVSVGLALYGIIRCYVLGIPTRFIIASQVVILVLQFFIYVVVIGFNMIDVSMSGIVINKILSFLPTYWLALSTIMSVSSIALTSIYQKEYM